MRILAHTFLLVVASFFALPCVLCHDFPSKNKAEVKVWPKKPILLVKRGSLKNPTRGVLDIYNNKIEIHGILKTSADNFEIINQHGIALHAGISIKVYSDVSKNQYLEEIYEEINFGVDGIGLKKEITGQECGLCQRSDYYHGSIDYDLNIPNNSVLYDSDCVELEELYIVANLSVLYSMKDWSKLNPIQMETYSSCENSPIWPTGCYDELTMSDEVEGYLECSNSTMEVKSSRGNQFKEVHPISQPFKELIGSTRQSSEWFLFDIQGRIIQQGDGVFNNRQLASQDSPHGIHIVLQRKNGEVNLIKFYR